MVGALWRTAKFAWSIRPLLLPADRLVDEARAAANDPNSRKSLVRLLLLGRHSRAGIGRQLRRQRPVDAQVLAVIDAILSESARRFRIAEWPPDLAGSTVIDDELREHREMKYDRKAAQRLARELRVQSPNA